MEPGGCGLLKGLARPSHRVWSPGAEIRQQLPHEWSVRRAVMAVLTSQTRSGSQRHSVLPAGARRGLRLSLEGPVQWDLVPVPQCPQV